MKKLTFLCLLALLGPLNIVAGHRPPPEIAPITEDLAPDQAKISPWVSAATANGAATDLLIVLYEQADLSAAYTLRSKTARGHFVRDALWETAQHSQAPLRAWLDARGMPYRAFYIVNALHVQAGDGKLIQALAARPDVARIEANPRIYNVPPQPAAASAPQAPSTIRWNIAQVNAPQVWALGYTGQGIVIGGQDTGYDWDHPALKDQYRGWDGANASHDYNWHDAIHSPGSVCGADSPEPCDDYGHGTHTMGTVLGDDGGNNQIGVAPGATWIGCRNMDDGWGSPSTYLECFEFFLAPYPVGSGPSQGNPDLAPDITNNSWGCPSSEGCSWDTLQAAVEAQRAAGILTVVSAGNSGSACSSVNDPPALYDAAYSVGATQSSDAIASFSSRGPVTIDTITIDGSNRLKPDISAPGVDIYSSVPGGGYQGGWRGTSMASPHVAGAIALLWSADPRLRHEIDATEQTLNTTAVPRYATQCGDPDETVPNNVYGWGRLDALAAVQRALSSTLTGTVSAEGSTPVVGAQVKAALTPTAHWTATSDADGAYRLQLISGTYTVTATAPGYLPYTATGVNVTANLTTTLDILLPVEATFVISGHVREIVAGQPLSATVSTLSDPLCTTATNPSSGAWTLSLPSGRHTLSAVAINYASQTQTLTVTAPLSQDFVLYPLPPVASYLCSSPDLVGATTLLTNTTTGLPPLTYTWSFGDGSRPAPPVTQLLTFTHTYTGVGQYVACLTATNAGGADTFSQVITITGTPPIANFALVVLGQVATFSNTSTPGHPPEASYRWNFGDGTPPVDQPTGQITSTHHYTASGRYTAWLTATNLVGQDVFSRTLAITPPFKLFLPITLKTSAAGE